jgi:putative glutamine amidotransferase
VTDRLPLIGISVGSGMLSESNGAALRIRSTYPRAVELAGGAPIMIPLKIDPLTLRAIYDRLDGVIISGGGDVDPGRYGATRSSLTVNVDPDRDEIEATLVGWAVEDDKPLLGICRGHQVLNVALGGTLFQDVQEEVPGSLRHDGPSDEWFVRLSHEAQVAPGSKLHQALGLNGEHLRVNSMHHQSVREAAASLCIVAQAEDGIVEGLEHPQRRFVIGVQWHPEALAEREPVQGHLFEAFVRAANP